MAFRENLIPTRTVDKNGKVTTVYVKPSAAGSASALGSVPVPVPSASVNRVTNRKELIKGLVDAWKPTGYNDNLRHEIRNNLSAFPDELLERIAASQALPHFEWIGRSVGNGFPESEISEQLEFFPSMMDTTYFIARNLIKSLHRYPEQLDHKDFTKAGDEVMGKCRGLLLVTSALNASNLDVFDDERDVFALKDERFVEFVINHSDKAELIIDFIRSRSKVTAETWNTNPLDLDLLTDVVTTESPAVSSGLL
jgi:hypothetical protein